MEAPDISTLPSVAFSSRHELPSESGIYFALSAAGEVLYIGKAANIADRWIRHHRSQQMQEIASARIAWLTISETDMLADVERALITYFAPPLNGSSVPATGNNLKRLLAKALADILSSQEESASKIAARIGYSRQRLHQLKSAHPSVGSEAIEEAINKLGYEVDGIAVKRKGE